MTSCATCRHFDEDWPYAFEGCCTSNQSPCSRTHSDAGCSFHRASETGDKTMKKRVHMIVAVDVEIDETKLTDEFNKGFAERMLYLETPAEHIDYIAVMCLRGYVDNSKTDRVIDGYGPQKDMGISAELAADEIYVDFDQFDQPHVREFGV